MEDFLITAKNKIPNMTGLKFASKDLGDLIGCLFAGKFNILCGCDEVNIYVKETSKCQRYFRILSLKYKGGLSIYHQCRCLFKYTGIQNYFAIMNIPFKSQLETNA